MEEDNKKQSSFVRLKQCCWNERSTELQRIAWYAFTFINIPLYDCEIWVTALFLPSINRTVPLGWSLSPCWCKRPGKVFRCQVLTSVFKYLDLEKLFLWIQEHRDFRKGGWSLCCLKVMSMDSLKPEWLWGKSRKYWIRITQKMTTLSTVVKVLQIQ